MNYAAAFALNLLLSLLVAVAVAAYLAPSFFRVLVDLCGTEDRARFWLAFSRIMLIGMPTVTALGYRPESSASVWYYGLAGDLSRNLMTLLVTLAGLGLVIAVFAAAAPRPRKENSS